MLRAVVEPLAAARVQGICVVTHSALARQLSLDDLAFIEINDNEDSEMIDSVRIGLDAWHRRETINDGDGFLIQPADHPGLGTAAFDSCIDAFCASPDRIVIAARQKKRGHPIIFPASFVPFIKSEACNQGLNTLPHSHPQIIVEVPSQSPAVTHDIDTPDDYRKLL